ncbi:MAG: GntR family transcriptional regulator [Blastopirellula sp.]|nr:MAG: GntR family transcriptional regulator [Blastopirellula sp.]
MVFQFDTKWTIEQAAPIGPQIFKIMRERIIRNDLEPGSRISESEIAADFSVSRQPVREVFIKLAEEGLLEVRPQRGTFVRKISISAVMDARFVREAIEADIVKLLAKNKDAVLAIELRKQLAKQRKVAARDPVHFMELDEKFHWMLAEAAGKAYAWNVVESVKSQMDRVRHLNLSTQKFSTKNLIEQHTTIVEAISAGDEAGAETAMRGHLREILNDLPAIAEANPEFFENAGK